MKKTAYLSLAVLAMCFSSCSSDDDFGNGGDSVEQSGVISAQLPGNVTRTYIDGTSVKWNTDDAIGVISVLDSDAKNEKFDITEGGYTTSATFTGIVWSGYTNTVAYYPYDNSVKYDATTGLSLTLPAEYKYDANNPNSSNKAPMAALFGSSSNSISFKNAGALMHITLNNVPEGLTAVTLTSNESDPKLNGAATVTFAEGIPTLEIASSDNESGTHAVTIKDISVTKGGTVELYFPVPVATYSNNLTLTATVNNNSTNLREAKLTAKRNTLYRANITFSDNGAAPTKASLTAASESGTETPTIESALKDGADVSSQSNQVTSVYVPAADLTTATETAVTITIPEKKKTVDATSTDGDSGSSEETTKAAPPVTITFDNIKATSDSKPIEIKAAEETSTSDVEVPTELTIAIPQVVTTTDDDDTSSTTAVVAPSFTVDMPKATVTVAANGATATYGTLTASTAENTLVVDAGVTVEKLVIKKGNVRLKGNATVKAITVDAENTGSEIKLYVESSNASYPKDLDSKIKVVDEATAAAATALTNLKNAAAEGGTYTLTSDFTLTEPLVVAGTMTLDLNGYNLKAQESGLAAPDGIVTKDAVVLVRRGAKLTINDSKGNGSIDASSGKDLYCAVKLTDASDESGDNKDKAAELIVNGGTLKGPQTTKDRYAICGNGTRHNTKITINGGIITGSTGIYQPQDGELTVTGGIITGILESGIEHRSGTLTITGGSIISKAAFSATKNGGGTTITGAAVAVSQHTTNKAINVSISGGTLRGAYAFYEEDLQDENTSDIKVAISGGTFNGKVSSENCKNFITGGTFPYLDIMQSLGTKASVKIVLAADATGDFTVPADADVTVSLNNHKVTNAAGDVFTVALNGKLTIDGTGTVDNISHGKACIYNNGEVWLKGGTYTRSKENGKSKAESGGNSYYNILNHGTMYITEGVKVTQSGHFSSMIANGYYNYSKNTDERSGYVEGTNAAEPKLYISGGTFSGGLNTIKNDDGAELSISGGTFSNVSQAVVQNHNTTVIEGGTFDASSSLYVVDNCGHDKATNVLGTMTISGGTFTGKINNRGTNPVLTVTRGTFSDSTVMQYVSEENKKNVKVVTSNE